MLMFLGKAVLACCAAVVVGFGFGAVTEGFTIKSKSKRKNINDEMQEKFKDGTDSSKEELQTWWDTYHK